MKRALAFLCAFGCGQLLAGPKFFFMPDQRFMPENKLSEFDTPLPVNITEDEFEAVLVGVEDFYKPLVKDLYGADLSVVRDWQDPTVNAYATQSGSAWEIHMYGGLARRPEITPDGFALVACHEMGHHLGGFPYVQSWAANEGQSDYFGTLSCARQLWKDEAVKNDQAVAKIPAYPKKLCDDSWKQAEDRHLCYRVALAGKSLADLLSGGSAKFESPSRSVVSATNNAHPAGQCRLDTYLAGAICHAEFDKDSIPKTERDSAKVSCLQSRKEAGFRPRCWFKPTL